MAIAFPGVAIRIGPCARATAEPLAGRLYFLDNLRIFATCVVIAHHVGQAYGPTGGAWPIGETVRAAVLGPFFTVNRSFGMSLFFLIAGYLMVRSYDAHGPRPFVIGRLMRLGIPMLIFMILTVPIMLLMGAAPAENGTILGLPQPNALHLWFVQHLLIYSLCYAGIRAWLARRASPQAAPEFKPAPVPGGLVIVLFALALAVVSATVRLWFPIDYWVNPAFIRIAFADVPRDLSFFVLGALACRHDWLRRYPSRAGYAWLAAGLLLGAFWYVYALSSLHKAMPIGTAGLAYAVWESLLCCGMCIGLVVLFRDIANVRTPLLAELSRSQYAAYVFHIGPVVGLQAVALALPIAPLTKFALVTVAAVPLTFLLAGLLRRPLKL
jgi:glucans biosynthesis protein C